MNVLDNVIIVTLIVGAFAAGMKIADRYHNQAWREQVYALQKQYARLQTGCDADDPVQPYVPFSVPEEFANRLKSNRRAVMQVTSPPQASAGPK